MTAIQRSQKTAHTLTKWMSVELVAVSAGNLGHLKTLNSCILPIHYTDKFYKHVLQSPALCRLARTRHNHNPLTDVSDGADVEPGSDVELQHPHKKRKLSGSTEKRSTEKRETTTAPEKYIGMVCCRREQEKLYVMTLGCLIMYRRRGIGTQLITFVLDLAKSLDVCLIQLHVNSDNSTAVEFYQRFGFVVKERVEDYYRYLKPKSALLLVKTLKGDGVDSMCGLDGKTCQCVQGNDDLREPCER